MKRYLWFLPAAVLAMLFLVQPVGCEDDDDNDNDDSAVADDDSTTGDDDNDNDDIVEDDDQSDDDDASDDDYDPDDDYPECDPPLNTPPELLAVDLIVNGEVVVQPYTATTDDTLALSIKYFDAECNIEDIPGLPGLHKGMFFVFIDTRDEENISEEAYDQLPDHRWYLPGIGCSSVESGPYVIDLDPQEWVVDESDVRQYPFGTLLRDGCDAGCEDVFLDFTVHAAK